MHKQMSNRLKIGVLLLPIVFAWFTLEKGYSKRARLVSFLWLFLVTAVALNDKNPMAAVFSLIILASVFYAFYCLIVSIFHRAQKRKEEMLAIINDDDKWRDYCMDKKLPPSAQKFILKSYGVEKPVIETETVKFDISVSSSVDDFEDNWKSYNSFEEWERDCKVLWRGQTKDIEFSYAKSRNHPKERRTVTPQEFGVDGNGMFFVRGICHKSNEPRTFKLYRFETKIKVGSQRFDEDEWIEKYLGLNPYELS
jgi:hypothetical protein